MTFFYIQLFQLIDGDRNLKGSKMKFFICNKDLINVPWLSLKKKKQDMQIYCYCLRFLCQLLQLDNHTGSSQHRRFALLETIAFISSGRLSFQKSILKVFQNEFIRPFLGLYVVHCTIWYHLYNLKNVKNTCEGVLILVKLQVQPATLQYFHVF